MVDMQRNLRNPMSKRYSSEIGALVSATSQPRRVL
jgi:hypothetical protein